MSNRQFDSISGPTTKGTPTWAVDEYGNARFDGTVQIGGGINSLTVRDLTAGRVPFVSTNGLLVDEADFAYASSTNTLTVDNVASNAGTALSLSAKAPVSGAGASATISGSDATAAGDGGYVFIVPGTRSGGSNNDGYTVVGTSALTGLNESNGLAGNTPGKPFVVVTSGISSSTRPMYAFLFSDSAALGSGMVAYKSASATSGTLAANGSGDVIAEFSARSAITSSAWATEPVGMYILTGQTQSGGNHGRYIQFRVVANGATAQTSAWRIASSPVGYLIPETDDTVGVGNAALGIKQLFASYTDTSAGVTGNRTINKMAGSVNLPAGGNSIVVTNSLVTTSTKVLAVIATSDATAVIRSVVPASGSFAVNMSTAPTAETRINWVIINTN